MANEIPAGLTLLKEWSTWLVSLQTGALGLVSFFAGKESFGFNRRWLIWSIGCFVGSIFFATWVLGALPSIVQRLPKLPDQNNFYNIWIFEWCPVPLSWVTFLQHWAFIVGLIFFVLAIAKGATTTTLADPGD